jgi:UDP-N-acetyl-D-glucosamine dehydrogenase
MTSSSERNMNKNHTAEILLKKIKRRTAKIGVIGLGYVGLPLAVEKAKAGYHVIGFDIQQKKVDMVNSGVNYIGDIVGEDLQKVVQTGYLRGSSDYDNIKGLDAVAICVPTPLDRYRQPDISYLTNSTLEISERLHKAMLVVLESTSYPGTTEEVVKPILESTGLKCGKDFFLVFSPERVDPGNMIYKTKNTPKVIGGVTPWCTKVASELYKNVLDGEVHEVSSPKVAEMEKIYENTFRNINIALANEMAIVCRHMGIDIWEVIDAAQTKPYGFMPFYPGPGPGGHCIPVDPFYLTWKAREFDYHTKLIETAGEINDSMPGHITSMAAKMLNEAGKSLNGASVFILGVAYKKDIDDIRESPALKIIRELEKDHAKVYYNDPYIPQFSQNDKTYFSTELKSSKFKNADITIITTDHGSYDYDYILANSHLILDTRNALKGYKHKKIFKL